MADPDDKKGGPVDQKIKVGEKEFTAEDVQGILEQQTVLTEKSEKAQRVLDAAQRFGLEPDDFLGQAMGAFTVVNDLMKNGVIDEEGNVVTKKKVEETPPVKAPPVVEDKTLSKADEIVAKAMEGISGKIDGLAKTVGDMQGIQSGMIRENLEAKITKKYPMLDEDSVAKVFRISMQDKSKDLWDVAKEVADGVQAKEEAAARKFAEQHGLDYDKLMKEAQDENSLKETGPLGGITASLQGKKFSFRKKGKGYVSPLEATKEYFKRVEASK